MSEGIVQSLSTKPANTNMDQVLSSSNENHSLTATILIMVLCCFILCLITLLAIAFYCVYNIKCKKSPKQQVNGAPPDSKIQQNHAVQCVVVQRVESRWIDAKEVCNNAQDGNICEAPQDVVQMTSEGNDDGDV